MRTHHRLLTALLAYSALIGVAHAQALPTGGTVAAGGVTITTPGAGQMTINQSTGKAIVNWQGFSIGQGGSVDIRQPDAQSVLLNRVTGATSSTIAGSLTANGQVFLINPNGIAISKTGEVSAAGFVASSLDIADEDFLAGKLSFKGDGSSATVSNQGAVTVGRGGYAALLGGRVDNAGSIIAPLGKVALGAGERATLDFSGDGFLQVAVPSAEQNAQPLIVQSGYIGAGGGLVEIRTAAARDAARKTINLDGVIEARGVSGRSGAVVLDGGGGAVAISGDIDVSATSGKGGAVTLTGEAIALTGARIDASGQTGGGSVRIGGDFQGKGELARAQTVTIDATSTVTADATDKGDGGRVIVWSDDLTDFSGRISARGGANGGDGGFTEVSGKRLLGFNGTVDLRAPKGKTGDLLLDPYNVTISSAPSTGGFTATGDNSVINVTTLQNALATANVTISTGSGGTQDGDITVAANIAWSANTLTLDAYRSIAVNANLLASGTAGLAMNFNNGGSGGRITYAYGFSANFSGAQGAQSLTINGQPYTLIYDAAQLQAITTTGLSGNYALATSFNAVATRNWTPYGFTPIGTSNGSIIGNGFTGTFDGLGNVVSNLFIAAPHSNLGLFGRIGLGGVVRNVGLSDVYISGDQNVGTIASHLLGTIQNSWASGFVSGTASVGGLVGGNGGVISQSFSLVGVKARDALNVGGLAGSNSYIIEDSYAMGAVLGGTRVGGIVGYNLGSISRSFAASAVHGNSDVGPLVGLSSGGGTVTASLYDSTRSYFGGGLTMAQFQNGGGSLATLGSVFAGGDNGLYPYLKAFFPNGAQALSGTAYKDYGVSPLMSAHPAPIYSKDPAFVSLNAMGGYWGSVTTDRNGYFYFLVPVGVLAAGNAAMVYTNQTSGPDAPGQTNAIHLFTSSGATAQSGLNLYGSTRTYQTSALLYSQTSIDTALLALAVGGNSVAQAAYDGTTNQRIVATGASYTIDTPVTLGAGGSLAVETSAAGSVLTLAQATTVGSTGALILKSAGALRISGAITTADKTTVWLKSSGDLIVDAPITITGGDQQGFVNPYFISLNSSSLTLDSAGAVRINAVVTNRGANAFSINHAAGDTNLTFARSGRMDFVNAFGGDIILNDGGRSLTINGENYSFITSMAALAGMNNSSGRFALVKSLTGGSYGSAVVANFSGVFDGLGHTINNLTINGAGTQLGLFGALASGSTVRNIGLNGGSITGAGAADVGSLAGYSQGSIVNVWSNATVIGGAGDVGGLVGESSGSIANSYVTGLVQGNGGATGAVAGRNSGSITDVLAAGLVFNTTASTGLVGDNSGVIDGALITGYAEAGGTPLGAAGINTGSVSNLYFDSDTTGFTNGGTGQTTAQLQSDGVPTGLSGGLWSGGASGKYAYLSTFFPNGIDVISGFARKADGSAWQAMISLAANGALISKTGSGANGYYYAFGAPGTLSAGQGIVAFTDTGLDALTFRVGIRTDLTTGLDLTETWRRDDLGALGSSSAATAVFTATAQTLTSGLAPANREITSAATAFTLDQAISTAGSLVLRSAGAVTQTQAISAGALILEGGGGFTLTHAGNAVGAIAGTVGSLAFNNTGALAVDALADGDGTIIGGLTATGDVTLSTSSTLTITADGQVSGANPVLSTGAAFVNLRGSDAVTATTGRWLVYAASHTGNTFGDLDSGNSAIFGQSLATLAPGAVTQSGNRYVFASSPTVHIAGKTLNKIYGELLPSGGTASDWAFLIGAPEAAGAFRAATIDEVFSGLSVVSSGLAATAGVGNYSLTFANLPTSIAGYTLDTATAGSITITPRAITVTADALSRIYGNANPLLTYTVGGLGLANGDTLNGDLATGATATSGAGAYGIAQGTLANAGNANYDITFAGANLTITPRAITVTADALSRIYGNANPALTYTVGGLGLVGSDSLTGTLFTSATTASGVGVYGINQGDLAASGNYDLTFVDSNVTVTPRAITVTADALSRIYGNANPALTYSIGGLGLVGGDSLIGALTTSATATSGVGAYGITQGTLTNAGNANYDITFAGADLTVTPRAITVTADALSRIYGNANPALTYTVGGLGLVGGDTLNGDLATGATAASGVGAYGITQGTLTNVSNVNYDITFGGANLTITPRAITVTADALSRIYGNANPALTYVIGGLGLVGGDTLNGDLATGATATSGVGAYGITQGDLAASANYDLTFVGSNLTITPRAITVTADALSRIYGNANPALSYSIGGLGLVGSDSLSGALTTSAGATSGVGAYGITQGDLAASGNYDLTFVGANLTITPRAITVTADALNRIYGNANPTLTYTVGGLGLVGGDSLTGALATSAGTTSGVGAYGITQGALTNAANGNYDITFVGSNLTITPRAITVTADALSRIYGNANPALTYTVGGLGLVGGDTLNGALATGATATSGVGVYGISQGDLAASGNYDLTFTGSNLTVTPRAITVTADALSRIYGNVNPQLTYVIGGLGLANGDALAGALATGATTTSGVGVYGITQGNLTASGNYDLTYTGSNLTVTPRAITVTADALSRIYGNANPALTYAIGGLGLANGDSLTGALATSAGATSGVGAYGITQGALTNANNGNYDITFVDADLTITPRAITVTADALSRIYGNANPPLTYVVGGLGLVGGDALTGALATSATSVSSVGVYGITQGNLTASSNYDLTYTGSNLTVTPRAITVTADALSRIYGNTNPVLTYAIGGLGLANGDGLTGALATSATTTSGVGAYGIVQGDLTAGGNYSLTFTGSNLTVTPRAITVTADALSRIYGNANPALTYVVGGLGLANGDSLTGGLTTSATTGSGVGTYGITQGDLAASGNYSLTFTGSNLTVTPRAITVTADALSRIYGAANPQLTYVIGGLGLANGDTLTGALATSAVAASGVGAYAVTQGDLTASGNYSLTFTGADLTITPRAITVTADALNRIYGNANPALTYTVGGLGLANGDTLTGTLATSATTSSGVGTYGVTQGDLAASANYSVTYVGADLAITPRAITVTADALNRTYGDVNPALSYVIGGLGLANGDSLTGALATTAGSTSGVGAYAITQGELAASSNYSLTFTGSNLTVTPRAITVSADALSRIYGAANPALTYTLGGLGLVNGDSLTGALATSATVASGVGVYGVTQGDLTAGGNYTISFTGADLAVTPRAITITADALSRIYGNANPSLTYTVGGLGLVNGDTLTGALATTAGSGSGVGAYSIGQGSLTASGNYVVSFNGATLTITPRPITITAHDQSRAQGFANPALTYTVGGLGLVNGDGLTGALATAAEQGSAAGTYLITQGDLTASANYAVTFQDGVMVVSVAPPSGLNAASAIQPPFLAPYKPVIVDSRPEDNGSPDDVLTEDERLGRPALLLTLSSR